MDLLTNLAHGFAVVFQPINLMWSLVGVTLGTLIGVLPGIGPALTIALLLPVTTKMDPAAAFIIFGGVYYGAMYGGSTTAILINTPGESGSLVTAIDGNKMARKGRAPAALATAAIGSFVAGCIGTLLLAAFAPTMVEWAVKISPAGYFALALLAFVSVSCLLGRSVLAGLLSLLMGVAIALVGIDGQSGQARYAFGEPSLMNGIGVVVVIVSLFAVAEALSLAADPKARSEEITPLKGRVLMTREDVRRSWKPWLRGAAIGFPFGALPAGGAEIPTFLSYSLERKLSDHPEEFGEGAIEGVAGPEAANNAAVAGVMAPLLALGLPTSATAAILLAAFQQYGLQPGPTLFSGDSTLVWSLIASLLLGNLMLLLLNLPMAGLWARLLYIPRPFLYAGILVFATLGVYGASRSLNDVIFMLVVGLMGFAMRRLDFPIAPMVVGLVLGPMAEQHFRRAMQISQDDWTVFFTSTPAGPLLALAAILAIAPPLIRRWRRRSAQTAPA